MNNQKAMIELIKSISGQANVLAIPRPYIEFMGSLDGGLFLSQLIYWSDRSGQEGGWFYKTYDEWETELTLSKYEVSKQVKILKEMGILETKIKKANGAPTVHYKFSFDEFQKSFVKFLDNRKLSFLTIESEETSHSITETTTKTTTDINATAQKFSETEKASLNTLADSVAIICSLDIDTASPQTRQAIKDVTLRLYIKKITATDLNRFKDWWYTNDWRGKKNQPPTPSQVGDTWGQFETAQEKPMSKSPPNHEYTPPPLTPEQIAFLEEFNKVGSDALEIK